MPKLKQYSLDEYINAVESLASSKGFRIKVFQKTGSAIRFEVYRREEVEIWDMWVVHTKHNSKRREIWSRDNYKKPDKCLGLDDGTFLKFLEKNN